MRADLLAHLEATKVTPGRSFCDIGKSKITIPDLRKRRSASHKDRIKEMLALVA